MPRMTFAVWLPLLALLAVLVPVPPAAAGPPEDVSGRMVLDEVANGLRKYRKARDVSARVKLLQRLALTRDPRVGVALWEATADPSLEVCLVAHRAFAREFVGGERGRSLDQLADDFEARAREGAALGLDPRSLWRMLFGGCGNGQLEEVEHLYRRAKELPR